jgi:predicted nucleic acid-binding protein
VALVIDASVAVTAALDDAGLALLGRRDLIAPPLLWSEACATLRQLAWREELSDGAGDGALARLVDGTITRTAPPLLYQEATLVARRLGWAKTYDAEYVALALIKECPLLTDDRRLRRRVGSLVEVIGPADL